MFIPIENRAQLAASFKWPLRVLRELVSGDGHRFLHLSPPFAGNHLLFDRAKRRWIRLQARDWTDCKVIRQIYTQHDYGLGKLRRSCELDALYKGITEAGRRPLIIDCGANCGMSLRYFAETYEEAQVIGVEPDPSNCAAARRNVAQFGARVEVVCAAIGSRKSTAALHDPGEGNWGLRVLPCEGGPVQVLTVEDLLARHALQDASPFLLKVDIEGFESDLFAANTAWIDRFPLIVIELHDWLLPRQGTSRAFLAEVSRRDRDFVYIGENVFSISNTF